ncbi:hypothetical protein D3C84_748710 [compost metagenome]
MPRLKHIEVEPILVMEPCRGLCPSVRMERHQVIWSSLPYRAAHMEPYILMIAATDIASIQPDYVRTVLVAITDPFAITLRCLGIGGIILNNTAPYRDKRNIQPFTLGHVDHFVRI